MNTRSRQVSDLAVGGFVLKGSRHSAVAGLKGSGLALRACLMLALLVLPFAGEAQHARLFRVGVLLHGGPYAAAVDGLRDGLEELGLKEGQHHILDVREGKGDLKAIEASARSLEAAKVDLIYSVTTSVTLAAKRATRSVPIVFFAGTDPVSVGLIESFRKPGGRLTGIHNQLTALTAKRLELLKEMMPKLRRVVTFYDPANPAARRSVNFARVAALQLGIELIERPVASVGELRAGLNALQPGEADAFFYVSDAMVASQAELIINSAEEKKLPTMFQERGSVAKGALAAYGESFYTIGRLSAKHVQRVLLGADPGELPVEQVDRLHFVINRQTARALGITIPESVLIRADEVIE